MPFTYDNLFISVGQEVDNIEVRQYLQDGTLVQGSEFQSTGKGNSYGTADVAFDPATDAGIALRIGQFFSGFGIKPDQASYGGQSEILRPSATPYYPYGWLGNGTPRTIRMLADGTAWIQQGGITSNSFVKFDPLADPPNAQLAFANVPDIASGGFYNGSSSFPTVGGIVFGFALEPDESGYHATGSLDTNTTGRIVVGDLDTDSFGGIFSQVWDPIVYRGVLYHIERCADGTFMVAGYYMLQGDYTSVAPFNNIVSNVFHIDTDGSIIDEFLIGDDTTPLLAMCLDPDGTSFWTGQAVSFGGGTSSQPLTVYKCAIADGSVIDSWDITAPTILSIRFGPDYGDVPPPPAGAGKKSWSPVVEFGLAADMPEPRLTHEFFWATDLAILFRSDGADWIQITGAGVGAASPLGPVLTAGNDGAGLQIKNIADATDGQDAVTLAQLLELDGGGP